MNDDYDPFSAKKRTKANFALALIILAIIGLVMLLVEFGGATLKVIIANKEFAVSLLAISIAVFTYFKHDFKLKKQQKELNQYLLEEKKNEIENSKRAWFEVESKIKDGFLIVTIRNVGEAKAKSVVANFKGGPKFNTCPVDLLPNKHFSDFSNRPIMRGTAVVEIRWADDLKEDNFEKQEILI